MPLRGGRCEDVVAKLARLHLVALDVDVLDRAATLAPASLLLRSLDAIHLAPAQLLGASLRAVLSYDVRMTELATSLCQAAVSPRVRQCADVQQRGLVIHSSTGSGSIVARAKLH